MNNYLSQHNNSGLISKGASTARALLESAQCQAQQILTQARQEAAEIIEQAKAWSLSEQEHLKIAKRISTITAWRKAVTTA